jgi:hypothetical protein
MYSYWRGKPKVLPTTLESYNHPKSKQVYKSKSEIETINYSME